MNKQTIAGAFGALCLSGATTPALAHHERAIDAGIFGMSASSLVIAGGVLIAVVGGWAAARLLRGGRVAKTNE